MAGRVAVAILALLALAACHRRAGDADAASSRGLQVEAYDPVIPKAPLKGKLDTMTRHPEDAALVAAPAPSDAPAADSSQPPKP